VDEDDDAAEVSSVAVLTDSLAVIIFCPLKTLFLLEVAALTTGPDGDEDDEVADVSTICCEETCCFRLDPETSDRSIMARSD